jgi:hypothetical protein
MAGSRFEAFWSNRFGTSKWLPSRPKLPVESHPAFPAVTFDRAVCHSDASILPFTSLRPSPAATALARYQRFDYRAGRSRSLRAGERQDARRKIAQVLDVSIIVNIARADNGPRDGSRFSYIDLPLPERKVFGRFSRHSARGAG